MSYTAIPAGERNRKVQILRDVGTERNEVNERIEDWQPLLAVQLWAKFEPLSGREYWSAAQVNSEITHRVVISYEPRVLTPETVSSSMRVKLVGSSRTFEILAVRDPEEAHIDLVLDCKEQSSSSR